jgi:hypothetical protein
MDLRCDNRLQGVFDADELTFEVKCTNSRCGARSGTVVLHKFSMLTGDLVQTQVFRDPTTSIEGGETNGAPGVRTAVRSA